MDKSAATNQSFRANAYFEPDILTAHQYFKVFRQKSQFVPEEKLMFAVLTDAIECFQKYLGASSRRYRNLFSEAEAWITSRESSAPFSFEQICEALNINPNYLRLGLMQWRVTNESQKGPRKRIREPLRYQYRVKNNRVTA
ncbi:MAG: hypothetical protein ACM3SP_19080 [Chloroflexota bacterium]